MKKIFFLMWALLLCSSMSMNAQVRIGGIDAPHAAAVLDLNANNDSLPADNKYALALPRVRLANIIAPLNNTVPANGMMVYNMGGNLSEGIYYWNGTQWLKVQDTLSSTPSMAALIRPLITWVPVVFDKGSVVQATAVIPPTGLSVFNTDTCALVRELVDAIIWDPANPSSSPISCVVLPDNWVDKPNTPPFPGIRHETYCISVHDRILSLWYFGEQMLTPAKLPANTPAFLPFIYWKKTGN